MKGLALIQKTMQRFTSRKARNFEPSKLEVGLIFDSAAQATIFEPVIPVINLQALIEEHSKKIGEDKIPNIEESITRTYSLHVVDFFDIPSKLSINDLITNFFFF
jgi:hypothetical protein